MMWLVLAIAFEVTGTMSLRVASSGRNAMYLVVLVSYVTSYGFLSLALLDGIPLGAAYGIWTAAGVALTAVLGRLIFKEPFTWVMGLGVVLVMAGVLMVEVGA